MTAKKFSEMIIWNFYRKLYGKALAEVELYMLQKIEIAINKARGNFLLFKQGLMSVQNGTTLKVDMKQVPVLQIYKTL